MQGIFHDAMERFVIQELGEKGLLQVRALTGRGDNRYVFDVTYPDGEIISMVQIVSQASGLPPEEVLQQFAEGLVPGLLDVFGFLVNSNWTFVDFLLNTEGIIHKAVRLNTPSAKPPPILAHMTARDTVAITYRSPRRLCSVAKGIIRGSATHYKVKVAISEERCMLRGDLECVMTVKVNQSV